MTRTYKIITAAIRDKAETAISTTDDLDDVFTNIHGRVPAWFKPMPTGPNAGFIALVDEIAALHKFREDAEASGTYSKDDDIIETIHVFTFLEMLHKDSSYLELLEYNTLGCKSAQEVFDFVYDCIERLAERRKKMKAAH